MSRGTLNELAVRAERAERDGMLDYALILLQELTSRDPTICKHWLRRARLASRLARQPEAASALNQAIRRAADVATRFEVADLALELREFDCVAEVMLESRQLFGDHPDIRRRLIEAFLMSGLTNEARWEVRRGLRINPNDFELRGLNDNLGRFAEFDASDPSSFAKRCYYILHGGVVLGGDTDDGLWIPQPVDLVLQTPQVAVMIQRLVAHLFALDQFPKHIVPCNWISIPLALAISTITDVPVSINAQGHDNNCLYVFSTFPEERPGQAGPGEDDLSFALCFNPEWALVEGNVPAPEFVGYNVIGTIPWHDQPHNAPPDQRSRHMTDVSLQIIQAFKANPIDGDLSEQLSWVFARRKLSFRPAVEA